MTAVMVHPTDRTIEGPDIVVDANTAGTVIGPIPLSEFRFALDTHDATVDTVTLSSVSSTLGAAL